MSQHGTVSSQPRELTIFYEAQVTAIRALEANIGLAGLQLHKDATLGSTVEIVFTQPFASSDSFIFILRIKSIEE